MLRVLVVEDDPVIAAAMQEHLQERLAAEVTAVPALAAAYALLPAQDAVILDLTLEDSAGLQTLRRVRRVAPETYILVVTAQGTLADRVEGLQLGADDYLVKPFSLLELEARLQAVLRRRRPALPSSDLGWDAKARTVHRHGDVLPLTPLEYSVFAALAARPGQALSRAELLREVIGPNFYGYERVIDVHVGHLRRKLDPDPYHYIGTVRSFGYRWDGPVLEAGAGGHHAP